MNREKMAELADIIEDHKLALEFDMGYFICVDYGEDQCGTAACIAGHAVWAKHGDKARDMDIAKEAREILGLDLAQGIELFTPYGFQVRTKADAIGVLRYAARTGEIVWPPLSAKQDRRLREIGRAYMLDDQTDPS